MLEKTFARRRVRSKVDLSDLPSFPVVIANALRELRDPSASLRGVGDSLASDPRISARLLRLANSTAFALRNPVRSVPHAVALLGHGTTESLLLSAVVSEVSAPPEGWDAREFWVASARRALIAQAIAGEVAIGLESESFTEALLQDMAIPYLLRTVSSYRKVYEAAEAGDGPLVELEQEALGYDHALVASWMAEHWEFPKPLIEALAAHHDVKTTPGSFVARFAAAEEEAFCDAASGAFGVGMASAKGWHQRGESAGEFAALLVGG